MNISLADLHKMSLNLEENTERIRHLKSPEEFPTILRLGLATWTQAPIIKHTADTFAKENPDNENIVRYTNIVHNHLDTHIIDTHHALQAAYLTLTSDPMSDDALDPWEETPT